MLDRLRRFLPWMAPTVLFAVNALLIRELFRIEYPASMYAIASAYIGLARHYLEHAGDLLWFPHWYGGLPVLSTYPPLLHAMVAGSAWLFSLSPAKAYHVVTAVFYCLVPLGIYGCATALSRQPLTGFSAGLLATLISPSALLLPWVRGDLGGWQYPRRLQALFTYGEGPHVASLLWTFLSILLLHLAFESGRGVWRVLAAIAMAATVLTNTIGAMGLLVALFAYLAAHDDSRNWKHWAEAASTGMLGYLLAAPFMPFSTLLAVRVNAPFVGGVFHGSALSDSILAGHLLLGWVVAAILRSAGFGLLFRFAAAAAIPFAGITISDNVYGIALLPQPTRYHLELELCLILGAAVLLCMVLDSFPRQRWLPWALAGMLLLGAGAQWRSTRFYARNHVQSGNIEQTIEFQSARWFDQHFQGSRVMVPGSIAQWFRAFTAVEQLGGGYDNGAQNPNYLAIHHQILSGDGAGEREAAIAVTWLKAFGVDAVQVSYPESSEVFHPYRNPAKFEGVLTEIWSHGGTRVYRVPRRHGGLAYVVPAAAVPLSRPVNGLDTAEAEVYVQALDDTTMPVSTWRWVSPKEAVIDAEVRENEVISVQVAHHPGWRAHTDRGDVIPLQPDGLGQMVLHPSGGRHRIHLVFTGGGEYLALWILFGLGLGICLALLVRDVRQGFSDPDRT